MSHDLDIDEFVEHDKFPPATRLPHETGTALLMAFRMGGREAAAAVVADLPFGAYEWHPAGDWAAYATLQIRIGRDGNVSFWKGRPVGDMRRGTITLTWVRMWRVPL